ncbi:hypothetical protein [Massilia sp. GCM10023247]|uniref:hypothetical protein n=1 Tax=Massilia sp. GCM10023247 TaxID=3252643 RepID=UPI0036184291
MDQLTRYFTSRLVGHGVVTVALDQDGRGSADIRCGETGEAHRARYAVDLASRPLPAASREDLLFQVGRRAISQFQQEVRKFRPRRRSSVLDLSILPWNGDLYKSPPLAVIGGALPVNAGRLCA